MSETGKVAAERRSAPGARPAAERVQPKLKVGEVNDPLEHEAEAMAEHVARGEPAATVSRMAAPEKQDEPVRRAAAPEKKKDEPVRRAAAPEKKKDEPVRRAAAPEQKKDEPVRRAAAPEKKKDEPVRRAAAPEKKDEAVRRAAQTPGSGDAMSSAAQHAVDTKGAGKPLDGGVRSRIESSTGADLSHVRVHDDHAAQSAAGNLSARAFTHGSDIWMGAGESTGDVHLMAHEAAHVLQQSGDSAHRLVQRNGTSSSATGGGEGTTTVDPTTLSPDVGQLQSDGTIEFTDLPVPPFKADDPEYQGGVARPANYRRPAEQDLSRLQDEWKGGLAAPSATVVRPFLENQLRTTIAGSHGNAVELDPAATYAVTAPATGTNRSRYAIGLIDTLVQELASPTWDASGRAASFSVDHILELQLSGQDTPANTRLLKTHINEQSGFSIRRNIRERARRHLQARGAPATDTDIDGLLANHRFRFRGVTRDPQFRYQTISRDNDIWTRDRIAGGNHFRVPAINTLIRVANLAQLGNRDEILVFPQQTGWIPKRFRNRPRVYADEGGWLAPWTIVSKTMGPVDEEEVLCGYEVELKERGHTGRARIHFEPQPPEPAPLGRYSGGSRYAGFIDKDRFKERAMAVRGASPIRFDTIDIDPDRGLVARGKLLPTIPLFQDLDIDLELANGELTASRTFAIGDFSVPPPLRVSSSSLTFFAATARGLGVEGRVDFGVERVGEGFLGASASTSGGFALDGGFRFDSTTFDPAEISMSYREGVLRGSGAIGIPDGKLAGVKRAQLTVAIESGEAGTSITGEGTLEPKVPAIQQGTVRFSYTPDRGVEIGGTLLLSDDIPNVQGGSVEATLSRPPGQDAWDLRARGTLTAGVAGFAATVNADYHNGLFTVEGAGAFERGMLAGTVMVGATNRAIGADGIPTDTIGDQVIAYGGGTVTVQLTPWLQGTVGVRFLPNGELELTGSIALPSVLEIFPEKRFDRNIFSLNLDIPIIGFSVAGQRIGIFATIGGGLDLSAGIGPGQLQDLGIGITYNPDHEDQTHITGGAKLVIPADAGLRLFIRGALGAGIPIVSAELGLEVGGRLGLEGAVEASVNVDWTPSTGLVLDALGEIYVQPKFRFDLTGYLEVVADLFFTEIDLYEKRWELAAFELGPDLRFGVRFPIHYEEGRPFDISLDDLQFEVPNVDTRALLGDIVDRIL